MEDQAFYDACDAVSADAPKPMRSPAEVREQLATMVVRHELYRETSMARRFSNGYIHALKWVLREE